MPRPTAFARWMKHCDLSPTEAAERLGIGRQRVYELMVGKAYTKSKAEARPDLLSRFAMAAIADNLEIDEALAPLEESPADRRLLLALTAARRGLAPWPKT